MPLNKIQQQMLEQQVQDRLNKVDEHTTQLAETANVTDLTFNGVVRGIEITPGSGLNSTITAGVAYLNGKRVYVPASSKTLAPSKDTYVDLSNDGSVVYVEVANGAVAPTITANSIRIGKYETNATTISVFTRYTRNVAIGEGAYQTYGTGYDNIAVGFFALNKNTSGYRNTVVGVNALGNNTTGHHNVALGQNSLLYNTTGYFNSALGIDVLRGNTTGSNNVGAGQYALLVNETGAANIAIGVSALTASVSGNSNIAIGQYALATQNGTSNNVAVGTSALRVNTTGTNLTAIGHDSGRNHTTGVRNTMIGTGSAYFMTSGNDNVAIGFEALKANDTFNNNTALGSYSLFNNKSASCTAIGYQSLYKATTGGNNTAVGLQAGYQITTGANNTFVGFGAGGTTYQSDGTVSNSTAIGNGAVINESNAVQLGNTAVTKVYSHGSFETKDIGDGFICKSPDGTRYKITVVNGGTISVALA